MAVINLLQDGHLLWRFRQLSECGTGACKLRYTERKMKVEGGQPWEGPALWSLSPIILCDQKCFYRGHQQTQPTPPPLAFSHDIKPSKPTNGCCLNLGNSGLLAGSKRKEKWPLFRVAYWSICLCLQYLPWYLEAEGAAISQHSLTHVTHSSPPRQTHTHHHPHSWWIIPSIS